MNFIANGDYNFPFDFYMYFIKHVYMWSFQTGTPNPDGIIRLPGRIFNFLVFAGAGNIAIGYFYQISCLVVAFFAFYFFAKQFLSINDKWVRLLGAAFFAVNPIFLGNLSKVGLILAAAMLPFCLLAIKYAFETRRLSILLLYVLSLNISLLHPYTFFVNLGVSALYGVYMLWRHWDWVRKQLPALGAVVIIGVALNAYFLFPLVGMGTVSKDAIADTVTPTKADYTAIVDVANTGDVFTGLALSKNIFLDFDFYNDTYQNVYYFGTFLLYIILLVLYLKAEKRLSPAKKQMIIICFAAFLALVALATVTLFDLGVLIKLLISLPGGWAFRSPLKWQLYIPLVLFTILVIVVAATKDRMVKNTAIGLLICSFVLMNGYQLFDIMKRQLTPRSLTYFTSLAQQDLNGKNLLFVNSPECIKDVIPYNSPAVTELNQVFTSENVQVKRAWADRINSVNVSSYDYVLTCRRNLSDTLRKDYAFLPTTSYMDGAIQLYVNQKAHPAAYATDRIYQLDTTDNINNKNAFVTQKQGRNFDFVVKDTTKVQATPLHDVFEKLTPRDLARGRAMVTTDQGNTNLLLGLGGIPLYGKINGNAVQLGGGAESGAERITGVDGSKYKDIPLTKTEPVTITYSGQGYDFKNLIQNPSLEQGLWQSKPNDCLASDTSPDIGMKLSDQHSDGKSSLQLESSRHIACSGPAAIPVTPGQHYLLSFDYQSPDGPYAGYYVGFDGENASSYDQRLVDSGSDWHSSSQEITVPARVTSLRVLFYAYPEDNEATRKISRFDNVSLVRIPPLQNRFFVESEPSQAMIVPKTVEASQKNPTMWQLKAEGVTTPFYLVTKETYHPGWQLFPGSGQPIADGQHFAVNGTMNAWYIDPTTVCQVSNACIRSADGTYTLDFAMKFKPQQQFYIGGIISLIALLIGVTWYAWELRHQQRRYRRR